VHVDPDFGRVATTVQLEESDRVPLIEAADHEIMRRFLGGTEDQGGLLGEVQFWRSVGYDYVSLAVGIMQPGRVTEQSEVCQVIRDVVRTGVADGYGSRLERHTRIDTEKYLEEFPWLEAARLDVSRFEQVRAPLPPSMKIIALSAKVLTLTWTLMGFEDFVIKLRLNPRLVQGAVEKVMTIQVSGLRTEAPMDSVAAAWAADDLGFSTGPWSACPVCGGISLLTTKTSDASAGSTTFSPLFIPTDGSGT
jgi:hypothetical protein